MARINIIFFIIFGFFLNIASACIGCEMSEGFISKNMANCCPQSKSQSPDVEIVQNADDCCQMSLKSVGGPNLFAFNTTNVHVKNLKCEFDTNYSIP